MSYGRNFGMRSFENVVRDGRFKNGANPQLMGAPVKGGASGVFVLAPEGANPSAISGLAVFEHIQNKSDALVTNHDDPYDKVPAAQYAQMVHGPGSKVFFANTAAKTLYDGRVRPAQIRITINTAASAAALDLTTLVIGDELVSNGLGGFRKRLAAGETTVGAWLVVEQVSVPVTATPTIGVVEARLTF